MTSGGRGTPGPPELPAARGQERNGDADRRSGRSGEMLAQWIPRSTDEERLAFYQRRLALFAGVFFWIFVILVAWVNAMYWWLPELRPAQYQITNYVAVAGLVSLGLVHKLVLSGPQLSLRALFGMDILMAELIGIVLGVASLLSPEKPANVASMFIWATLLVFARVCAIPSRGRRTLLISAGVFLPQIGAFIYIVHDRATYMSTPSIAFAIGTICYSAIAVALAAIGSEIIYGLRKKVREAKQLGQYTLVEEIGAGGMGRVYRAQHTMLRRPTALKLLSPDSTRAGSLARFEREVQLSSELTHPNTIAIFDYGRSPDGVFYYAMEYLDGIDLEQLIRVHGPQPAARVVHILIQICGALDEAHGRGLIHRDVKPANVILCWRGNVPDVAKVLDFGLVKDVADATALSSTEIVAGTPAYMAPEAITKPDTIGPASDLYALGAMAYYLLTARVVFEAETVLQMCVHHVSSEPVAPSQRTDNPIPAGLETLIMQCLNKAPEHRPASAAELAKELELLDCASRWTDDKARIWWADHPIDRKRHRGEAHQTTMTVDLEHRARRETERGH